MTSQIGKRVNPAMLSAAPLAQAKPVRFMGTAQPLLRTKAAAPLASRRLLAVQARAATEEKPEIARVSSPSLFIVFDVLAMPWTSIFWRPAAEYADAARRCHDQACSGVYAAGRGHRPARG